MAKVFLRKEMSIGNVSAEEDDEFLYNCFFDHSAKSIATDKKNSKCFLLGNTGIGKTAIISKIRQENENANIISLSDLSMGYISNSTAIKFIKEIDVPLDYFFQALWRHIIVIEYIRISFDVTSTEKSQNAFSRILEKFRNNEPRRRALEYLEKWSDKFWVTFDENIREIELNLEREVSLLAGAEYQKFKTDVGYKNKLSELRKTHLQSRLQTVVDASLLSELGKVQDALSDYAKDNQQKFVYILIDGLDENWVGIDTKYKLIKALIEAVKSLRKVQNLKIISAMRVDLLEKVIQETRHDGFQSEKYKDYFVEIRWKGAELRKLLDTRVNYMYRNKYSSENVFLRDVFPNKINKKDPFDFLSERTLLRPRDAISFINHCFFEASENPPISVKEVQRAERNYSEERRRALVEEWAGVYPGLEVLLSSLVHRRASFPLADLLTAEYIDMIAVELLCNDRYARDPLCRGMKNAYEESQFTNENKILEQVVEVCLVLHLVGAIGLNTAPHEPMHWFYKEGHQIPKAHITKNSKIRIHPMLHSSLGINTGEKVRDYA
ncbi:P-loop ATPase, Sll1717 family [Amaricoccus macauensis]|uniref:P-loop ATPase, Sll1717 family n=1 Tax=Amaricoccus macauensis TaxID=57001 RepID=UPI003C7EAA10